MAFRSAKEKAGYGLEALEWLCVEAFRGKGSLRSRPYRLGFEEQSFANLPEKGWPRLRVQAGQQFLQHCLPLTQNWGPSAASSISDSEV